MQKLSILLILFTGFLLSCQPEVGNLATGLSTKQAENIKKTEEIQPLISPTPKEVFNIHSKIGIVEGDGQTICLRTKNINLTEKTPVSLIVSLDEKPQKVLTAIVERKLEKSCSRRASEIGDKNPGENFYYSLILTDDAVKESDLIFGLAVIQSEKQIQVQNNLASVDLTKDGKLEFFRRCEGSEGVLLTIWTGKPLIGKRIWHSFYYLDYDTEANCKKKDWEGTDNERE
jgi:hypothetical protein